MRAQSISANNQMHHLLGSERLLRLNPTVPTGSFTGQGRHDALFGVAAHISRDASPRFTACSGPPGRGVHPVLPKREG